MALNRFLLEEIYSRLVYPLIPPYPQSREVFVEKTKGISDKELKNTILHLGTISTQYWKLGFKLAAEKNYWYFPIEPLVSLSGKNNIIRRNVSKNNNLNPGLQGTVKECWSRDDYNINISGILRNFNDSDSYPVDVQKLRFYCEAKESINVESPIFAVFGISQIVIENWEIPHTAGQDMQAFSITAYSDNLFELLIDTVDYSALRITVDV